MCRVCSGALWILRSIVILHEPAHEITDFVGLSCNEGSDEPAKMHMLVRVPPKDQREGKLILEKEYIKLKSLLSRRCCLGRGFESR